MQHLQAKFRIGFYFFCIQIVDIIVSYSQSGGVKFKFRIFICSNSDSYFTIFFYQFIISIDLFQVVKNRNAILKTIIDQVRNILFVFWLFITIADDISRFRKFTLFMEDPDDGNVISRRSFYVDVILQRFFQHEIKMRRFGAITIGIISFVIILFNCIVEPAFCFLYLRTYLRQIGKF